MLRIQIERAGRDSGLPDLNEITIRVPHVAAQFRCMDFRLGDEFRAARRPKVVIAPDVIHAKVEKDT